MSYPNLPDPYQQPYSSPPYTPAPYSPAPLSPGQPYYAGVAPYGLDPMTGLPLSDKSKVVAGLLQILPGVVLGLGGIGRFYAGHTTLGVVQIVATICGWVSFWCGFLLLFPFLFYAAAWIWFVIDGIVIMAGRSTDGQGRLLRT